MKIIFLLVLALSPVSFAQSPSFESPQGRQAFFGLELFKVSDAVGIGFDASTLWNKDFGWTMSFKIKPAGATASSVSYQTAKNYFGDSERGIKENVIDISIGRTYGFNDNFFIAGMIGYESYTKLVEFYDPTGILGQGGKYYVEKDKSSQFVFTGKVYYSLPNSNWGFTAGYQSGKVGTFLGIGCAY